MPSIAVFTPDESARGADQNAGADGGRYAAVLATEGAVAVPLRLPVKSPLGDLLAGIDGVVFAGAGASRDADGRRLCRFCRALGLPLLAVGDGLHGLNTAFGGTPHSGPGREQAEAVHRHAGPGRGDRHVVAIEAGTRLAACFGLAEIVFNRPDRGPVATVARGFRVSARAPDGVVEAIEPDAGGWFAFGVRSLPVGPDASCLDARLFRWLVEAGAARLAAARAVPRLAFA